LHPSADSTGAVNHRFSFTNDSRLSNSRCRLISGTAIPEGLRRIGPLACTKCAPVDQVILSVGSISGTQDRLEERRVRP
jgi:hypothetical protein